MLHSSQEKGACGILSPKEFDETPTKVMGKTYELALETLQAKRRG